MFKEILGFHSAYAASGVALAKANYIGTPEPVSREQALREAVASLTHEEAKALSEMLEDGSLQPGELTARTLGVTVGANRAERRRLRSRRR